MYDGEQENEKMKKWSQRRKH